MTKERLAEIAKEFIGKDLFFDMNGFESLSFKIESVNDDGTFKGVLTGYAN